MLACDGAEIPPFSFFFPFFFFVGGIQVACLANERCRAVECPSGVATSGCTLRALDNHVAYSPADCYVKVDPEDELSRVCVANVSRCRPFGKSIFTSVYWRGCARGATKRMATRCKRVNGGVRSGNEGLYVARVRFKFEYGPTAMPSDEFQKHPSMCDSCRVMFLCDEWPK
jgi:hypothetical protein